MFGFGSSSKVELIVENKIVFDSSLVKKGRTNFLNLGVSVTAISTIKSKDGEILQKNLVFEKGQVKDEIGVLSKVFRLPNETDKSLDARCLQGFYENLGGMEVL